MNRARIVSLLSLLSVAAVATIGGCASERVVPESGAALLEITTTAASSSPAPDELRVWAYDDRGRLWDDVRVPEQGHLGAPSGGRYGTLLVQPGTIVGLLRVHVRALAGGTRVLDGVASIAEDLLGKTTVDLHLDGAALADDDADDVPDVIDDCLGTANPAQGGCPVAPEASDGGADVDTGADAVAATDAAAEGEHNDSDGGDGATGDGGHSEGGASDGSASDGSASDGTRVDGTDAAEAGRDAGSTTDGGSGVDACASGDGGCGKAIGAMCAANSECGSGSCADGVCCNNACAGACRSCNQPKSAGSCQGYAASTDPERECGDRATCDGAGACVALPDPKKANGQACTRTDQCTSGFCTDGVCCNNACNSPCQNCSTGTCKSVTRGDDVPECTGKMTCNNRGNCS